MPNPLPLLALLALDPLSGALEPPTATAAELRAPVVAPGELGAAEEARGARPSGVRPGGAQAGEALDEEAAAAANAAFRARKRAFDDAFQAFVVGRREGRDTGPHPAVALYPDALALARQGSGEAVLWCLQFADLSGLEEEPAAELRAELYGLGAERHVGEPGIETVVNLLRREGRDDGIGRARAAALLRAIGARTSDPELAARARYSEGYVLVHRNEDEVDRALGAAAWQEVIERWPESDEARRARGKLFALEHLRVGQPVPDFTATDTDGVELALSDYRGRVVVLSFWGLWCAPCVALLPHERELARRHASDPFALLGVSTDENPEVFARGAAEHGVTWRNVADGSTKGPLCTAWGVTSFPSIYVIDARGVLRGVGVRGEELDRLVAELVAEARGAAPAGSAADGSAASREDESAAEPSPEPSPEELAARAAELAEAYRDLEGRFHEMVNAEGPRQGDAPPLAVAELRDEFVALGRRGSPAAWHWVLLHVADAGLAPEAAAALEEEALRAVLTRWPDAPFVPPVLARLRAARVRLSLETCAKLLDEHAGATSVPEHAARARLVHATLLEQGSGAAAARARALALYREVATDFADTSVAGRAAERAARLERVVIGESAPALAGVPAGATATVRLADLSGRVVVVSFWSLRAGGTDALLASDAELARAFDGRPFAHVAVCVDRNPPRLAARIAERDLPWPTLLDGASGPLADAWGVTFPPVRFVVDAEGVLRHVDLGDGSLREVVEPLVEHAATGR